jgi:CBS domain-containing protein
MFSQRIKTVMEHKNIFITGPETTVSHAAKQMAHKKVSAVLVVNEELLVGIFTERDAVFRVIARGLDVHTTRLADVMTPSPQTVDPEKTFGYALLLMHENGFRHVPVVVHGKPVGLVTSRSALDPDLEEFVSEERRRTHIS